MRANLKQLLAVFGLLLLALASSARADSPPDPPYHPLRQLIHRPFPASAGAPAGVWAMTQDRDGFLWLGGPTGLFKFDGVTFDGSLSHLLPHPQIMSLLGARDGSLWVGDRSGYITRIANGNARVFPRGDGVGTVMSIVQTKDGAVWAIRTSGLYRFSGTRWERFPETEPEPREHFQQGFIAGDQSIWILRERSALQKLPGASTFELRTRDAFLSARLGRPGGVWRPDSVLAEDVVDDDGAIWCGTNAGVVRVIWPGHGPATGQPLVETFGDKDGLTGSSALATLKDRDGTLWVATPRGIDQFRWGRFHPLDVPGDHYKPAIATDAKDHVWVSTQDGVTEFGEVTRAWPQIGKQANAVATALDGTVLMTSDAGLLRVDGATVRTEALPEAITNAPRQVRALTQARDGSVWIAYRTAYRSQGSTTVSLGTEAGLPGKEKNLRAIARRTDHGLWLGYDDNTVAAIEDDGTHATVYTAANGITTGQVTALWPKAEGVWLTGDHGVQFFTPGRAPRTLLFSGGGTVRVGTGIVESSKGDLWINAADGLYHVTASDMQRWWADASQPVPVQHFDQRDGWPGLRDAVPAPSLIPGDRDRLWVASDDGVARLDPAQLSRNPRAPQAVILGVNDTSLAPGATLDAGTTRVAIRYTAPVLAVPERARFSYRLSGIDKAWRDVGNVREATYTNLAPGRYTFEVRAANEDGVWATSATRLPFRITPYVYQTTWFALACLVAVVALLYALYAWRLRVLGTVLLARVIERERIARELHDTVLQGLHGVLLYVRVATNAVKDGAARDHLEHALRVAEKAMAEGRQRIVDLRTAPAPALSLGMRLRASVTECLAGTGIAGVITIDGEEVPVRPEAEDDLHAVVLELVRNVRKHARAHAVDVHVRFGTDHVDIEVSDDGVGVVSHDTTKPLSFGLQGVHERIARWSGQFALVPGELRGTRARLTVPAAAVYVRATTRRGWLGTGKDR